MKRNLYLILILPYTLTQFSSCKKPGCLTDAGTIVVSQRPAASFHQIELQDNINLVLTQDTIERIRIEAGENLQPVITTNISNGLLTIKNAGTCSWLRSPSETIKAYVSVKNLDRLNYNGSGQVTTTNTLLADGITFFSDAGAGNMHIALNAKRTYAYIYGVNTDMIFSGKSDSCYIYTGQRGTIDFRNFIVKHQKVGYGSLRDGYVHATESLHVLQYFRGTLYYKGKPPQVTTEYFSTGKVLPMD
ncbi:MAG: hypothetical protein JWP88_1796 [Flaviaesturariibacter sp.]|nr:hypothetical protein [Flaviaesturariibacter sp.]